MKKGFDSKVASLMTPKVWLLFLFLVSLILLNASARSEPATAPGSDDPYYQITEVHADVVLSQSTQTKEESLANAQTNFVAEVGEPDSMSADPQAAFGPLDIAQLVVRIWQLVQANKPVVTVQHENASALPNIAKNNWVALTGWQPERAVTYHVSMKNAYGMTVIDMEYQLKLLYGGSYRGKGLYIASAQVIPSNINVLWGFDLNMSASAPSIINIGSKEDPLAAITLDVAYSLKSLFKNEMTTQTYLLQGDGLMKDQKSGKVYYPAVARSEMLE